MNFKFFKQVGKLSFVFIISFSIFAHENPICIDTKGNSCWSIQNENKKAVSVLCSHEGLGSPFRYSELEPQKKWSFQYCSGLSDGLGFAGNKVNCQISIGKNKTKFDFESGGLGDIVFFRVLENEVQVEIQSYWSKTNRKLNFSLSGKTP